MDVRGATEQEKKKFNKSLGRERERVREMDVRGATEQEKKNPFPYLNHYHNYIYYYNYHNRDGDPQIRECFLKNLWDSIIHGLYYVNDYCNRGLQFLDFLQMFAHLFKHLQEYCRDCITYI